MSRIETCQSARIGEMCTIRGHIHNLKLKKPRPHLSLVEITVVDNTGTLLVTAFRQPWLMDSLKAGDVVALSGKVTFNYGFKRMTNPFIEVLGEGDSAQAAVIPIHGATEKLSAAWVRRLVSNGLQLIEGVYDPAA
jgi:ATP-dependent DNA helicase RecG